MIAEVTDFCRLFLVRHPELAPEFQEVAVGGGPAQLGRRGQDALVDWLTFFQDIQVDGVFTSDQPHCRDAGAGVALGKGLEVQTDERLQDQALGAWEGRRWDDIAKEDPDRLRDFFADFGEVQAPNGESLGEAIERFLSWWGDVREDGAGKTFVVVTAGGMLTGFAAAMLGMRLSRAVSFNLPHAGMGVLDIYENGVRVSAWNVGAFGRS